MRIYIAHSMGLKKMCRTYVKKLEKKGHKTYFPARDTPQESTTAEEILKANLDGIEWAEEVHVFWDGSSYGTIFDLGNAYALDKPIKVIYVAARTWYSHLKNNLGQVLE